MRQFGCGSTQYWDGKYFEIMNVFINTLSCRLSGWNFAIDFKLTSQYIAHILEFWTIGQMWMPMHENIK